MHFSPKKSTNTNRKPSFSHSCKFLLQADVPVIDLIFHDIEIKRTSFENQRKTKPLKMRKFAVGKGVTNC